MALDGKPKFDVTKFNQAYFDRLRERVIEAGTRDVCGGDVVQRLERGISKGDYRRRQTRGTGIHSTKQNNINGVDGDVNNSNGGAQIQTLGNPPTTMALQEAYVRKVIDTVNDLDNVLYEISNEARGSRRRGNIT